MSSVKDIDTQKETNAAPSFSDADDQGVALG
jgi:hypothetical protein